MVDQGRAGGSHSIEPQEPAMLRTSLSLAFALLATSVAGAQSFNIDVGSVLGVPTNTYAAGATQAGFWNQMSDGFGTPLLDLGGASTAASISALGANFAFWNNNPSTNGDDEQLLDDACDGARIYTIDGLTPGTYAVYTYAWAPDSPSYSTTVNVQGSNDPPQNVGGVWSGTHQLGVTYALHQVTISGSQIVIDVVAASGFATVNGFQIVEGGGTGCPLPATYCTAKTDSLGCASSMSFSGQPSASAGSGFDVSYGPVPGANVGLFIYTTQGANPSPPMGSFGFLCIGPSGIFRTGVTPSGGTAGACDGSYGIDFNAFFASQTADGSLVAGATVDLQVWFRDPPNPGTANLSNAATFTMCP